MVCQRNTSLLFVPTLANMWDEEKMENKKAVNKFFWYINKESSDYDREGMAALIIWSNKMQAQQYLLTSMRLSECTVFNQQLQIHFHSYF